MQKPAYDPGLTRQFGARLSRAINRDGSFNVRRAGVGWRAFHPWLHVVNMSWAGFAALILTMYVGLNLIFGFLYFLMPPDSVTGSGAPNEMGRLLNDFFFSGHTLTTVGYGNLSPHGVLANLTATFEALIGLLTFSLITGFLVARVSRPSARIGYSRNVLISPYNSGTALMFRIANERSNSLMELQAQVLLMTVVQGAGVPERKFDILVLERDSIQLFPLTWTIVHPLEDGSPLYNKSAAEMAALQAELIILVKAFDETFSQTVHSRFSYRYDEIVWGAKFLPAFKVEETGDLLLDVAKLGEYVKLGQTT